MLRKLFAPALAALVMATVTCRVGSELPPVTTVTTATTAPATPAQAIGEFQSCLGSRGLVVPDLVLDENGRPDLSLLAGTIDEDPVGWREALTACAVVLASTGALDLSGSPDLVEAIRTQLVAFAVCMRSQGVEAFPDPPDDFDGTTSPFPLSEVPTDDPDLGPAAAACSRSLGATPLR